MNVNLTPALEKLVQKKVKTGRYNSASEVVREALRLMEQHDSVHIAKLTNLRRRINEGLKSLDRGRGNGWRTFHDEANFRPGSQAG